VANVDQPAHCDFCGRGLPVQDGSGRKRQYCDATCRSAARRRRAAGRAGRPAIRPAGSPASSSYVNKGLTTSARQRIVDNVPSGPSALAAIGRAQARAQSAEEELAMSVAQARGAGHTWVEIGQVLGTSRQAAFQRFGRPADPRTGRPMEPAVPAAGDLAGRLFDDLTAGHWAAVCARFGPAVAARLDPPGLAAAWAQVIGMVGRYERRGAPSVYQAGDHTIVDLPLFFEAGERMGRVSYDRDTRVAGLFFLPRGLVDGEIRPA
jgi:hypothetical protein